MIFDTRKVQFLSLLLISFVVAKMIPFAIGFPLSSFFAALIYYYIGWLSIAVYYGVLLLDGVLSYPAIAALAEDARQGFLSAFSINYNRILPVFANFPLSDKAEIIAHNNIVLQVQQQTLPIFSTVILTIFLYVVAYTAVTFWLLACFRVIRRTKIIFRLKGVRG